MTELQTTPSQTVGPFLSIGMEWFEDPYVVPKDTAGGFWIRGHLYDGADDPVPDGMIESWQADPDGRFNHPDDPRGAAERTDGFRGIARSLTNAAGEWNLFTVRPGSVPTVDGQEQAPHIDLTVMARGMLNRVVTRIYFSGEKLNDTDPVLSNVDAERRGTLIAQPTDDGFQLDIRLQGDDETVFFIV
ncbi:protocatechuate 3,4-dioxygenase subunit alpha [Fodinicola acaciae]|uniref:protocatechuate 3,4-dioxygenase subunit alpha n=1 Tax=Fodinicola acaciae TaxID=2681555 RepID=UPI0013D31D43|nr:protocatechuate 3,4-dioxygenase subunit alpha [Fodinicola acaciae]